MASSAEAPANPLGRSVEEIGRAHDEDALSLQLLYHTVDELQLLRRHVFLYPRPLLATGKE